MLILLKLWKVAKALGGVAIARTRQLADIWSTSTTDVIVIGLMAWCALVLHFNPNYLASSPRLSELGAPYQRFWEMGFTLAVIYQAICLIFGSEDLPLGVVNPLMRTERQSLIWKCLRMAGWLFSMFFNFLIALLISKQGWLNFGTGFFAFAASLSTIAFSIPCRMFCADIRTRIDRKHQRIREDHLRKSLSASRSSRPPSQIAR